MSHLQFVRYCQRIGADPAVYERVSYPHPYIILWLECRKQANPITGAPSYPDPERGYMEQDADLMLAFEVLEELQEVQQKEEEQRRKLKEQAARQFGGE